tara:strand:+ start:373 stop:666 length:294 start_codon:yes stop_codon:yes gene_type:complete
MADDNSNRVDFGIHDEDCAWCAGWESTVADDDDDDDRAVEWEEASSKAWEEQEVEAKQMDKIRKIVDQYNNGLLMPNAAINSILLITTIDLGWTEGV